ncbi:MAG: pyruvate dehydrogenase (acetyl-transferring) E1 component subunit alpha, partial [Corynebacterium variabile]|nr:pyruvate dehydrogenase (acetyl-transferring) E1 component subunit alpha [Corynebacterium variabile]
MSDTTATAPVVDFAAIKAGLGEEYDNPFQVLDENHKVVNQEVFDTFTADQLVHFMELMLRERILHEQTTVFSKQ